MKICKEKNDWVKVGSIVHPYFRGIWEVLEIIPRKDFAPLVKVKKLSTQRGKPCKPEIKECDIGWCRPVEQNTIDYAKSNGCKI